VTNRTNQFEKQDFTFRVDGKLPEIWNPVDAGMIEAGAFTRNNGCITLPLELDRFGSVFIVFSKNLSAGTTGKSGHNYPVQKMLAEIQGPWRVAFDPRWGGPGEVEFPKLVSWTERKEDGIRYYSGKAVYRKTFDIIHPTGNRLFLDLGKLSHVAEIRLNGKDLGILWCAPWQLEVTGTVKQTGNVLEIGVINLWANRVIGDLNLPAEKRLTTTHGIFRFGELRDSTPLIESGLLGPVRILSGTAE
jgi:hypothetical protein